MKVIEIIKARGHKNIRATHSSTIEITKEPSLTLRGNCIIAVGADKALKDLSNEFKTLVRSGAKVTIEINANNKKDVIIGYGDPKLTLSDETSMVIRRSNYVCSRTLIIKANKAAKDLNRELIEKLRNPEITVTIKLIAEK